MNGELKHVNAAYSVPMGAIDDCRTTPTSSYISLDREIGGYLSFAAPESVQRRLFNMVTMAAV